MLGEKAESKIEHIQQLFSSLTEEQRFRDVAISPHQEYQFTLHEVIVISLPIC